LESGNKKQIYNAKDEKLEEETGAQDMEFSNDPDLKLASPEKRERV